MGASTALNLAISRPDLIKSLSLCNPSVFSALKSTKEEGKLLAQIKLISRVLTCAVATGRPDLGIMRYVEYFEGEGAWRGLAELDRRSAESEDAKGGTEGQTLLEQFNVALTFLVRQFFWFLIRKTQSLSAGQCQAGHHIVHCREFLEFPRCNAVFTHHDFRSRAGIVTV